ncbi:extracellular solute-binding protein [Paenibacillus thalictri]|uniref:Extracellular solute-binding protein n=1 Tax=Paenibacillus thalictri TaxID=2527873 RepID=A0A4V2J4P9_9BACL|nr:extracellular solute-binding protein [Paenibacillus thalictri]
MLKTHLKQISFGVLAAALAVTTAACGNGDKAASGDQKQGAEPKKKVTHLNFWGAIPPETGPQELVDAWNKAHPDIQVTYTRFVNDDSGNTKLEAALLAGNVDVYINYAWETMQKRITSKLLEPLDPFLDKENFNLEENFGKHPYETGGKRYFMPTNGGSNAFIMYNKNMLEAAGIKIPDKWTWDDYMKIAKQLTKGEGNNKIYGSIEATAGNHWASPAQTLLNGDYTYKEGKPESNFDDPAFLKSLQIRYQMENIDQSQVPLIEMKASKMDMSSEFTKGHVAMINNYNSLLRDIRDPEKYPHDFVTAFAPMPTLTPEQNEIWSGGLREWISMSPQASNKEAAYQFLKYYATDGYYPMINSVRIPAWKKANTDDITKYFLGDKRDKLFDLDSFKKYVLNNPMHRNLDRVRTEGAAKILQIMTEESEKALLKEQSVEDAIKNMKKKSDDAIKSSK